MQVIIKFQNDIHSLGLPENCTISKFKTEISNCTGVQPKNQKIIFQGKSIFDKAQGKAKLSNLKIVDGSRCLLLFSTVATSKSKPVKKKTRRLSQELEEKAKKQNPEIIQLGPPKGAEKSSKNDLPKFPQNPFVIYDQTGNMFKMALEEYSIWLESENGEQDRILFPEITHFAIDDIEGYKDEYKVVSMVLNHSDGRDEIKQMYFLPNQYTKALNEYLSQNTKAHVE